jgi:uncharacterized cupin superfamily protein
MSDEKLVPPTVVNTHELPEVEKTLGHYGAAYQNLTPSMRPRGGRLGINRMRLPKGRTTCPFHYHLREDEAFYVLSGRGVLRYGDEVREIREGDCISCPAGTTVAHQIANPFDEDLVYLAIGVFDPHEVCVYPDSDKVLVRGVKLLGQLEGKEYFDDEPQPPKIFELAAQLSSEQE